MYFPPLDELLHRVAFLQQDFLTHNPLQQIHMQEGRGVMQGQSSNCPIVMRTACNSANIWQYKYALNI